MEDKITDKYREDGCCSLAMATISHCFSKPNQKWLRETIAERIVFANGKIVKLYAKIIGINENILSTTIINFNKSILCNREDYGMELDYYINRYSQ